MIDNEIFVFGSNLWGHHGAGAALFAAQYYGARGGKNSGRSGNSYAIPTKDRRFRPLLYVSIDPYVEEFLNYAAKHPELTFKVTQVGCGYAGLKPSVMSMMFEKATPNCHFDSAWKPWLGESRTYWGTQ